MDNLVRFHDLETTAAYTYDKFLDSNGQNADRIRMVLASHQQRCDGLIDLIERYSHPNDAVMPSRQSLIDNGAFAGPFAEALQTWSSTILRLNKLYECEKILLHIYNDELKRQSPFVTLVIHEQLIPKQVQTCALIGASSRSGI